MRPYLKPMLRKLIVEKEKACYLCGRPVAYVEGGDAPYDRQWKAYDDKGNTFHFEHVIPIVNGGVTDETNIRLACMDCNLAKSRREHRQRVSSKPPKVSRVIRVEDQTYDELDKLRVGRQTFSDVIGELLSVRLKGLELFSVLEGRIKYREWQGEQLKALQVHHR